MAGNPAHIGRVANPSSLNGLCRDRPDPSEFPVIVGDYDTTPAGGRNRHPNGPWEWCCHCQASRHWSGFVVADTKGRLYLIGSECGAKHYDGEHFRIAKRNYRDVEHSRTLDRRLFRLRSLAKSGVEEINSVLNSPLLAAVDAKRQHIERACPDVVSRLANFVRTGSTLTVPVQARGLKGAGFTTESIGPVQGGALVFHDVRSMAQAAREALEHAATLASGDGVSAKAKGLRAVTTALENLQRSVAELNGADRFFDAANTARLEQWSDHLKRVFVIRAEGRSLIVAASGKPSARIDPFGQMEEIKLPICAELLSPMGGA